MKFNEIVRRFPTQKRRPGIAKEHLQRRQAQVFRSIVKEAKMTESGVELEMYVQPTQNVWWKYRQKKSSRSRSEKPVAQSIRISLPSAAAGNAALSH